MSESPYGNDTRAIDSELQWWLYDDNPNAGYTWLRALAGAIKAAYATAKQAARGAPGYLWVDPAAGERVYWLGPGLNWETADVDLGNALRVRFPMRRTIGGQWPL